MPVGVKICSPINPNQVDIRLSEWQPYKEEVEDEEVVKNQGTPPESQSKGPSDLGVALALYKQEKRRWSFQPVESCYAAYQVCWF